MNRQFDLQKRGDVSRRLNLTASLHNQGGWRSRRTYGPLSRNFVSLHFGSWYAGPSYYPRRCWYPRWNSWVDWSWWDSCNSYYDPRPVFCRPSVYGPSPAFVSWNYPTWQSLPVVSCGTWVDVDPLTIDAGYDLQLLAVRFVDPGHPEKKLGPRYRVWYRNNSPQKIEQPFNIMLIAANGTDFSEGQQLPEAGVRATSIEAGEMKSVDIRLPFEANQLGSNDKAQKIPFTHLNVIVDSHREVPEAFEDNNGIVLAVGDIFEVDPTIFAAESDTLAAGSLINIAGEGLGPEPGQVIVFLKELELQGEIHGWYDLGVRVKLPNLPLAAETKAEIVVVRGDGAVSNALSITLTPPAAAEELISIE